MRKIISGHGTGLARLALAFMFFMAAPALGFDFSQYEESSLKDIAEMMANDTKEHEIKDYTGMKEKLSFYLLDPYRLRVCPASGPVKMAPYTAQKLDYYLMNLKGR